MNSLDVLIAAIMAFGLIRGVFRGLVREVASIVGVSGGFFVAYHYYPRLAGLLAPWIANPAYLKITSFLVVFFLVMVVVGVVAVIAKYLLNLAFLGWVDRIGGALFGALKGGLVGCVIVIVLTAFLPQGAPLLKHATLAPPVAAVSEVMVKVLSREMKADFTHNLNELRKSWQSP